MSEEIETLLTQIATGDNDAAAETFTNILNQKVSDAIESRKSEVIQAHFGDKE